MISRPVAVGVGTATSSTASGQCMHIMMSFEIVLMILARAYSEIPFQLAPRSLQVKRGRLDSMDIGYHISDLQI